MKTLERMKKIIEVMEKMRLDNHFLSDYSDGYLVALKRVVFWLEEELEENSNER